MPQDLLFACAFVPEMFQGILSFMKVIGTKFLNVFEVWQSRVQYLFVSNDQPIGQSLGDQHDCRSSGGARTGTVRIVDLAGGPGCCGAGAYHFFDAWQKGFIKEMLIIDHRVIQ